MGLGTALRLSRGKAAVLLLQHKEQTGEFRSASQSSEREREERERERSVDRSASNSRAAAEREREIKKQVIATPGTRYHAGSLMTVISLIPYHALRGESRGWKTPWEQSRENWWWQSEG